MEYIYIYLLFAFLFLFIYFMHRGKVEDYSHLKPYREITLRELVALRYVEHRIRFSIDSIALWMYHKIKKKKVYRFDNISNASIEQVRNGSVRGHSYFIFKFEHQNLEHELRISSLMCHYLINIQSATAVEFTKEAIGEWYVLGIELEEKEESALVKQKVDYIELYKLMNLRENNIDSSLVASKVHRASTKERREFEFYTLGSIIIWTTLLVALLSLFSSIHRSNFSDFFLVPIDVIALWYGLYLYKKRVWYWKNSKVYTVKGELSFDYNLYAYTLNEQPLHLSKAWENFFRKHIEKSQSYLVEMDLFVNRYEETFFMPIYQPIRLKVLNRQIDYKKLPTRKHPLFLMVLVVSFYYILFDFNYQEPLKKSYYGLKNIYKQESRILAPYKEVEFTSYPVPILDEYYNVIAYTLVDDNKTVQDAYSTFKPIKKSFKFHDEYIRIKNDYKDIGYSVFKLRMALANPLEKGELNTQFLSLLKKKYKLLEELQLVKYKTVYGKEKEKYAKLKKFLSELDSNLSLLYYRVQQNDILIIKKELQAVVDTLKPIYSLSNIYIENKDAIYNYEVCQNPKECYDELVELYKTYNKIIVPPKLENIKGVVNSYFYLVHHINLIEQDSNYNKDMNATIVAMAIWGLLIFFFVFLLVVTLYRTILYIWWLLHYLITYNREDKVLKQLLEKVSTPNLEEPKEKQFRLTLKITVIIFLSFFALIILLAIINPAKGGGSSSYAKRAYEERQRAKEWKEQRAKEEKHLLHVLKRISK